MLGSIPAAKSSAADDDPPNAGTKAPEQAIARITQGGSPENPVPLDSLRDLAISPDGRWLAFRGEPGDPSERRRIHLWDLRRRAPVRSLTAMAAPLSGLSFSPDSRSLASSAADSPAGLQQWSVPDGASLAAMPSGRGRILYLADSGQLATLTSGGTSEMVLWRQPATGAETQRFLIPVTYATELSQEGRLLAATPRYSDATLRLIDVASGRELRKLGGGQRQPSAIRFSPTGRTLAAAIPGEGVVAWEVATGERVGHWNEKETILAIAISADDGRLAAAGRDGTVRLVDLASGRDATQLRGHAAPVSCVAFSPDAELLATGSFDRTVILWDLSSRIADPSPAPVLTQDELLLLWDDLAATSAAPAYRALHRARATSFTSTPWLIERLRRQLLPPEKTMLNQWVRDLDAPDSLVRQRATEELKKLGELARPVVARLVKESPSAEVRLRARRILAWADRTPRYSATDTRRMLRFLHLAETNATPDVIAAIDLIRREYPDAQVQRDAERTAKRLRALARSSP